MEDIEYFVKIIRQKRQVYEHELNRLDKEPDEHRELMNKLRDLKRDREQSIEDITKHLHTITSYKHFIHKIVHSTEDISGLPVPHDNAQDITMMFIDIIQFLNNIGDIYEGLTNAKENNIDPANLLQTLKTCTEAVENKLYQTKCCIAQLETLKESIIVLQRMLNNFDNIEDSNTCSISTNDNSMINDIM